MPPGEPLGDAGECPCPLTEVSESLGVVAGMWGVLLEKRKKKKDGPLRGEKVKALDLGQKGVPRRGLGVPGDDGGQGTTNE